jgi:hypothetical protein
MMRGTRLRGGVDHRIRRFGVHCLVGHAVLRTLAANTSRCTSASTPSTLACACVSSIAHQHVEALAAVDLVDARADQKARVVAPPFTARRGAVSG